MAESPVDPGPLMDLINGMRKSQALFAAVELGLLDTLGGTATDQGMPLQALAAALAARRGQESVSEDGLSRLLDACCALKLVRRTPSGGFLLTPLSAHYLTSSSPASLHGYVVHSSKVVWPLFGGLQTAVIKGQNVWQEVLGKPGPEIFANLYADESALLRFMHGMHSFATLSAAKVVTAFDLSRFKRWVDLGGATGALMVAATLAYPDATAVVVDLAQVVDVVHRYFTKPPYITDEAMLARVQWAVGNFFSAPDALPRGDVYVLSRILHDWDEEACKSILRAIYNLLPPGGAVLIAEMLLDEDHNGPVPAALQSLNMLVQTHGKERTASEYEALLAEQGFQDMQSKRTGTYLDAVLAFKPAAA